MFVLTKEQNAVINKKIINQIHVIWKSSVWIYIFVHGRRNNILMYRTQIKQAVALRFFESSKLSRISSGKGVHHFQLRTLVNQICKTWWSWAGNHVFLGPPGTDPAARNISLDGGLLNITPRSKNKNTWNEISISNCLRHPETELAALGAPVEKQIITSKYPPAFQIFTKPIAMGR